MIFYKKISKIIFLTLLLGIFFMETPAFSQDQPIARLADFSGTILMKSHGTWGIKPATDLPLYSMDQVVTRIGAATIIFNDGDILDITSNSNLLIREEKKQEGVINKVNIVERRILLFMGKMFFKIGTGEIQTQFETDKTVVGIHGAAGVLSVGSDGQVYIAFAEGEAKFALGDLIYNQIAKDIPTLLADQHPIQNQEPRNE